MHRFALNDRVIYQARPGAPLEAGRVKALSEDPSLVFVLYDADASGGTAKATRVVDLTPEYTIGIDGKAR